MSHPKPPLGSRHKLLWHPKYGDVKLSDCYCTVVSLTDKGPWVQPTGQPVLTPTWEEWARMVGQATPGTPEAMGVGDGR